MALLLGPCHNFLLNGILKNSNKLAIALPFEDINSNLWQISINEISFCSQQQNLNLLCGISTNFVTDLTFNSDKQVIKNQPILWQVLLKGNVNDKEVVKFDKSWFYITNAQQNFEVTFHFFLNGKIVKTPIDINCEIYMTVLLQRVK